MERVSSQFTLLLRIGIPTIWVTTVLSIFILLLWAVQGRAHLFSNPIVWIVLLLVLASGIAFIYFILWKIYRVDMDETHVYISNYFRTFKYPFSDVESIRESKTFPGRIFIIRLKSKGTFGQEIAFLASQKLWIDFIQNHPDIFLNILTK